MINMISVVRWLSQEGPQAAKHRGWKHPIATCVVHYLLVSMVSFWTHDFLVSLLIVPKDTTAIITSCDQDDSSNLQQRRLFSAIFLCCYATWLLLWRLLILPQHRQAIFYEYCFLCNVTLVVSAVALAMNRPLIAGAYSVTVGIE